MLKMILDSHNVSAPNYGNQFHGNKIYSVGKGVKSHQKLSDFIYRRISNKFWSSNLH